MMVNACVKGFVGWTLMLISIYLIKHTHTQIQIKKSSVGSKAAKGAKKKKVGLGLPLGWSGLRHGSDDRSGDVMW